MVVLTLNVHMVEAIVRLTREANSPPLAVSVECVCVFVPAHPGPVGY